MSVEPNGEPDEQEKGYKFNLEEKLGFTILND